MAGKKGTERKKRKRGVRRFFSKPKKACRTYGAKKNWRYKTQQPQHDEQTPSIDNDTQGKETETKTVTQENDGADTDSMQIHESTKPQLRVLSLFDGISAGYYALSRKLGIDVAKYYSSEIDKDAIEVQQFHFFGEIIPIGDGEIIPIGDVTHLSKYCLKKLQRVDLLLGGAPCNDISKVNVLRRKLYDPAGTGILFFDFVRIRDYLHSEAESEGHEFYWMFENVTNLDSDTLTDLNMYLGCQPIKMIPSCSSRQRYFWGNVPYMQERGMEYRNDFVPLQKFLKPFRAATVDLLPTITTCSNRPIDDAALVYQNGKPSYLFTTEIEKSLNFPPHFTDVANLSATRRQKLLGRTWDISMVAAILEPLTTLFRQKINTDS